MTLYQAIMVWLIANECVAIWFIMISDDLHKAPTDEIMSAWTWLWIALWTAGFGALAWWLI
jgi:hypothetical protein